MDLRDYLRLSPVVPVLTIRDVETAPLLARALVAGGLKVLEVTLRTSVALEAMERIVAEVEDVIVAAGTVVSARDLERSATAGAQFAFSPGLADFMLQEGPIPILPGVATPSELMKAMSTGIDTFKFFPAVPAGGVGALRAFGGPFSDIAFCPTGGIDQHNAHEFLALPNVLCVGGSWVAPQKAIEAGDWAAITALAKDASALRPARK